jgi:two-component SAPR family response regulator
MEECILIVFDLHLAVTSVNVFSVVIEMQQWVPLALLSSYKIFCTAVNNINVLRYWSHKGPDICVQIYPNLEFVDRCS